MALRRGRKGNLGLEVMPLIELALPAPDGQRLLSDRHAESVTAISDALGESLGNISRLQGWLTQYAFEAVVVALGAVRLIKTEDSGLFYFDDSDGELQPPDFRVVLGDGTQLLIEVKNVPPVSLEAKVRAKDMAASQTYAQATGGRLLYAHFWSGMGMWTLVDPSVFNRIGSQQRLPFVDAIKANEMQSLLGDGMLASEPPLTFSVVMDSEKEKLAGNDWRALTIGGVELRSAGQVITDPDEQNLAWFLVWHGDWEETMQSYFDDQGRVERVDFIYRPETDDDGARLIAEQGFAFFGPLSKLYTLRFLDAVTTDEGEIRALRDEPEPALLAQLVPEGYWAREDHVLRIWRFRQIPAKGYSKFRRLETECETSRAY
ncbi:hypothetical protein YWIDRAFT_08185 [Streptomyces sp. SceaMP-e96]|uniref:hypothetical protein n=1 Tax=unclassified Streptomyces TaxID=2593676 RepID=UPI000823A63B|nr:MULTISPECIES: hypothetical protein [unclassified Streptomyces]MYT18466.1 hypothetical protein [Streptomyces sp. SID4951]SCK56922.1 hypothetical protein YWIDRAFT_08185 [Streptomyces sp. SceaMP-e96]